jgi:hypothetical protein
VASIAHVSGLGIGIVIIIAFATKVEDFSGITHDVCTVPKRKRKKKVEKKDDKKEEQKKVDEKPKGN